MRGRALVILPGAGWTAESRAANQRFREFLEHHHHRLPRRIWISDQPWDGMHAFRELQLKQIDPLTRLVILGFSAGVVGALRLSTLWSGQEGGLIAIDGWCVPLGSIAPFGQRPPRSIARLSHDLDTHWNGLIFGPGQDQFYADPFVSHLQIWSQPHEVLGWGRWAGDPIPVRISAADFLLDRIQAFAGSPR